MTQCHVRPIFQEEREGDIDYLRGNMDRRRQYDSQVDPCLVGSKRVSAPRPKAVGLLLMFKYREEKVL